MSKKLCLEIGSKEESERLSHVKSLLDSSKISVGELLKYHQHTKITPNQFSSLSIYLRKKALDTESVYQSQLLLELSSILKSPYGFFNLGIYTKQGKMVFEKDGSYVEGGKNTRKALDYFREASLSSGKIGIKARYQCISCLYSIFNESDETGQRGVINELKLRLTHAYEELIESPVLSKKQKKLLDEVRLLEIRERKSNRQGMLAEDNRLSDNLEVKLEGATPLDYGSPGAHYPYAFGVYFPTKFDLVFSYNHREEGDCFLEIPDFTNPSTGLLFREEQSLSERITSCALQGNKNVGENPISEEIIARYGNTPNLMAMNITFIVSRNPPDHGILDCDLSASGPYAVYVKTDAVMNLSRISYGHSEDYWAAWITKESITQFIRDNNLDPVFVHAVILDAHSTNDMCFKCFKRLGKFQPKMREVFIESFTDAGVRVDETLKFAMRYSSDILYHNEYSGDHGKSAIKMLDQHDLHIMPARIFTAKDLAKSANNLMLLAPDIAGWHGYWSSNKVLGAKIKAPIKLTKFSMFASSRLMDAYEEKKDIKLENTEGLVTVVRT